jgi:hypothetical protein
MIDELDETFEDTSSLMIELPAYEGMKAGDLCRCRSAGRNNRNRHARDLLSGQIRQSRWKLEFNVRDAIK